MPAELLESMLTLEFYAGLTTGALAADVVKHMAESRARDVADATGADTGDLTDTESELR